MYTITIISPNNIFTQISNIIAIEKRDIYTGTILEKVDLVDNKAKIPCHLT